VKSKRQTTIANRTREKLVQERRELKREKKLARKAEAADGDSTAPDEEEEEE